MSEQGLDDAEIDAILQEMRCKAMPQHMHADRLVETRRQRRRAAGHV